jgi:selenocysteine-specific elongation factor
MKHAIIGTAGHIDHGKTALVKALSGIECDTHKEEKRRGITINLGFAHCTLPGNETVGIVDVPGHRDFIHTMVAGACGIDAALLVVAADGGVMPQTREHIAIMSMLGVAHGVIALTRIDLVDDDMIGLVREEIAAFVKGTFLEGCEVVPVSSVTGEGIDILKQRLAEKLASVSRSGGSLFRMYIDRIFSVSGFGTVVTGSVLGGKASTGDMLHLLPGTQQVRIRRMERYGHEVQEIFGGDRASLNVTGLSRDEFTRGMMLTDRSLNETRLLDARVELFSESRIVTLWSQVQFLIGTFEAQVRMHLIDQNSLQPGEQAIVQLHLPEPCVVQAGDRFILRSSSNDATIGGGTVIDAAPLHHRRRPAALVSKLQHMADGNFTDLVVAEVKKHPLGMAKNKAAELLNCSAEDISAIQGDLPADIVILTEESDTWFVDAKALAAVTGRIRKILDATHRKNPLDHAGRSVEEFAGMIGSDPHGATRRFFEAVLRDLERNNMVKKVGHTWALAEHGEGRYKQYEAQISLVEEHFGAFGLKAPTDSDVRDIGNAAGVDSHMLHQILRFLLRHKKLYVVEKTWLHASVVDSVRIKLLDALNRNPEGLTVAAFRDLISGNRKICLLFFSLFDDEKVTVRDGDVRRITDKGRQVLAAGKALPQQPVSSAVE